MKCFRLYDERPPPEPEYPCVDPPMAVELFEWDEEFSESQDIEFDVDQKAFAQFENLHAPPGSVVLPFLNLSKRQTFELIS